MADSILPSIFSVWNKLQDKFSSAASSSYPCEVPRLTKLNDMVYEVYTPAEERPELDIVFFHGLARGNSKDAYVKTWMSRDNSQLWIQTWLVELFPKARILTVTYDSSAEKSQEFGNLDMYCTAENLVASLIADEVRVGKAGTPVVFVGHSLGGLVLKELCLSAAWMGSLKQGPGMERIRDLLSNLQGMFYYGTPHVGSLFGDKLHNCFKGALREEMETLKASSARRYQNFDDLRSKYGWITSGMGELRKTYVEFLGTDIYIVTEASSRHSMDTYYSANADHYDICKAEGKNSSALQQLGNFIRMAGLVPDSKNNEEVFIDLEVKSPRVLQAGLVPDSKNNEEFFIDLEGRAKKVRSMLARADVNQIFIVGLSGLGKTSLARQVYQSIGHNFDAKCFVSLDSIKGQSDGSEQVWRKIQEGLGGVHFGCNQNLSSMLYQLKSKSVLMVLDNVESQNQIDVLRIGAWLEGSSSKLIVTSRTPRFGNSRNTFQDLYLTWEESLQLFRHYSFQRREGPHALTDIVAQVIAKCDGYPLFVKVLAGFVSKESIVHEKQVWLDLLKRLEKAEDVDSTDYRLWAKLKICYNALLPSEQEIFLDIAVIFDGFPLSLVKRIWKVSREEPNLAWSNLKSRFLVSETVGGIIQMHAQLRNLGLNIASPPRATVEKWRRISGHDLPKKLQEKLVSKNKGIMETLALELKIVETDGFKLKKTAFRNYDHLQYLILEGGRASTVTFWSKVKLPRSLVYLRWKDGSFIVCPLDFTGLDKLVVLELLDCKSMTSLSPSIVKARRLQWLDLGGCSSLPELPQGLSKDLQYIGLEWTGLKKFPNDFQNFKKLVHLKASETILTRVPQGLGGLEMLTYLNLRETGVTTLPASVGDLKRLKCLDLYGTKLTSLPESIGQLRELQELELEECEELQQLPDSFGRLLNLEKLTITSAYHLETLPDGFGNLAKLKDLTLKGCRSLKRLPDNFGDLCELRELELEECEELQQLPNSFGRLLNLWKLTITSAYHLETLSDGFGNLAKLEDLSLKGCRSLKRLPENFGDLCDLRGLELEECEELQQLPNSFGRLLSLEKLTITSADLLETLPDGFSTLLRLRYLSLKGCRRLKRIPENFSGLLSLAELELEECEELQQLPDSFGRLLNLEKLTITSAYHLETLPVGFGNLAKLKDLNLKGCRSVERLPENFGDLCDLRELELEECEALQQLPDSFGSLLNLEKLTITSAYHLEKLSDGFGNLAKLKDLSLKGCRSLKRLPDNFGDLCELRELELEECEELQQLPNSFGRLLNLWKLTITSAYHLETLPDGFGNLPELKYLSLKGCRCLQRLPEDFGRLVALRELALEEFEKLEILPDNFGELEALQKLTIRAADNLEALPESFGLLSALQELDLKWCGQLQRLPCNFHHLSVLERLSIQSADHLQTLSDGFGNLVSLRYLSLKECQCLERLPASFGHLSSLEELELDECRHLETLPDNFYQLKTLKRLVMEGVDRLEALTDSFGSLAALKYLRLNSRQIFRNLPARFGDLATLQELELIECCQLERLPDSFCHLVTLQKFTITRADHLKALSETFGNLPSLQYLSLKGCRSLERLPESFGCLLALQKLELEGWNELQGLPSNFGKLALQELDLKWCGQLQRLPDSFGDLASLERLRIHSADHLETLSDGFGELASLKYLSLKGCRDLKSLPESFGLLSTLQELELEDLEELQKLPDNFGELVALQKLTISSADNLEVLPESFGLLSSLQELHLKWCGRLRRLPNSFGALSSLKVLSIKGADQLDALPESLGNLSLLEDLFIGARMLRRFPNSIGNLHALRKLTILAQRLRSLPEECGHLSSLVILTIQHCRGIETLPDSIGRISTLRNVFLQHCSGVKSLPDSLGKSLSGHGYRRSATTRPIGKQSSQTASTEDVWLHVEDCPFLNDFVMQKFGWIQSDEEDFDREGNDIILLSCKGKSYRRNQVISDLKTMAPNASAKVTDSFTKINDTLWTLYAPAAGKATLDIVFFHGLQLDDLEDAFWKTWAVRDSKDEIWPRKWLSEHGDFSQARMLSVSYNSSMTKVRGQLRTKALAENLISDVIQGNGRVGQDCPVIFVGHSWGGLVIKQLVVEAFYRRSILQNITVAHPDEIERITKFLGNIRGVYYYGTPHNGSRLADLGHKLLPEASPILELLGTLNEDTAEINSNFEQQRTIPAAAMAEGLDTAYGGSGFPFKGRVVEAASAQYGINQFYTNTTANHITVCKAESADSIVIQGLTQFMSHCLSFGEAVTEVSPKIMALNASAKVTDSFTKINDTLWTLYAPAAGKATLDIVFFHGLQLDDFEDAFWKTWAVRGSKDEIWPRKWLSHGDFSQARMLSVSYNSSVAKVRGQLRTKALAENLISDVIKGNGRVGQDCPVILVGHSWGGLVIKQLVAEAFYRRSILQKSTSAHPDEIERITKFLGNIRGVYYYATPHNGSRLADLGHKLLPGASPILELLGTLNEDTAEINNTFDQLTIPAAAMAEGLDTAYGKSGFPFKGRVVEAASAQYGIHQFYTNTTANHITVCKAESADSIVIQGLTQFMSHCLSLGESVSEMSDLPTSGLPGSNHAGISNRVSED